MTKVITYGTFDLLHYGHQALLMWMDIAIEAASHSFQPEQKVFIQTKQRLLRHCIIQGCCQKNNLRSWRKFPQRLLLR